MTEASTASSPCNIYYLIVERLASNFAVYPIGRLSHSGNWLVDERILSTVNQLEHGCLYLDCAMMKAFGSESLGNLVRLCRLATNRDSRVILCNLQPHLEEFVRAGHHNYLLRFFDLHAGSLPGSGPRLPDPSCLAWNNGTIPKLAQAIHEDRAFDLIPILADALKEAGCINADILNHCRQPGEHVQGCWLIDLLLRKK